MYSTSLAIYNFKLGGKINPDCYQNLGEMYQHGEGMIVADIIRSIKYFEKAYYHKIKCTNYNIGYQLGSQYYKYANIILDKYNMKEMKNGDKEITKIESRAITEAINYYKYSSGVSSFHALQFGKKIHEDIFIQTSLNPLIYFEQAINLGMNNDESIICLGIFYFLIYLILIF